MAPTSGIPVTLLGMKQNRLDAPTFAELPLDILCEIFGWLQPADLLTLTRTTKPLRRYLLNRKTRGTVWIPVIKSAIGELTLPENVAEPKLVNFLFFTHCDECGLKRVHEEQDNIYRFPETFIWLCRKCVRERFVPLNELAVEKSCLPCGPKHLHKIVPSVRGSLSDRKLNWPKVTNSETDLNPHADTLDRRYLYHIESVDSLRREWAAVHLKDQAHAKQFYTTKCVAMEELRKFGEISLPLIESTVSDRKFLVEERVIQIQERLRELGWWKVASGFFRTSGPNHLEYKRRFGGRYESVTDEEWSTMQAEMIGLMEAEKERWVIFEKIRKVGERFVLSHFQSAFLNFAFSQPPNTVFPAPLEVVLMPEWVDALTSEPLRGPLSPHLVEKAVAAMPDFCGGVVRMRTEELLDRVRESKTFEDRKGQVTPDLLVLASTVFRCKKCNDSLHYPHVLAHHCNYSRPTDLRYKWWEPDAEAIEQDGEPDTWTMRALNRSEMAVVGAFARFFETDDVGPAEQTWNHLLHIRFDDTAHEHALHLLDGLGMDPRTSVAEMEERQPYVFGLCPCFVVSRNLVRWIKAIHMCKPHAKKKQCLKWFSEPEAAQHPLIAEVEAKRTPSLIHSCFWMPITDTRLLKPKRESQDDTVEDYFDEIEVEHPEGSDALREYVKARTLESSAALKQERAIRLRSGEKKNTRK